MRKIDLANPKTDVEKLGHKFKKWYQNRSSFGRKKWFVVSDINRWLTGSIFGDREDAYMLIYLWEKCGFISKTHITSLYTWTDKRKKHELRATGPKRKQ
jgi:hypothetical protein